MSLNVKDPEAHRLAEAITKATGETLTRAVIRALEERLERISSNRHKPEILAADIKAIAQRASKHIRKLNRPDINPDDFLYDEHGLPK